MFSKEKSEKITEEGKKGLQILDSYINESQEPLRFITHDVNPNITWSVVDNKFIENMKECPFAKAMDSNEIIKESLKSIDSELIVIKPLSPPDVNNIDSMSMDFVYKDECENIETTKTKIDETN
ncbi:hypothetical protein BPT24_036 [Tenacibaculum phage pT24]|uniref:Uncharacterized protein n=1 Tax=Tenacibaculum phage pT24 TaxID=1880590 RepID=A0A1B4XWG5_9CAUD|nr:hypothetical protein HYP10_gp036 [Tenacibaculum phage pT24]BAV39158.1 hypothetical protein BPT24_036 [Tenacibaculum phage pT24]